MQADSEVLKLLLKYEILTLLKDTLEVNQDHAEVLLLALQCLTFMCKAVSHDPDSLKQLTSKIYHSGIADLVEDLQGHKNDDIYKLAYHFITTFMPVDNQL